MPNSFTTAKLQKIFEIHNTIVQNTQQEYTCNKKKREDYSSRLAQIYSYSSFKSTAKIQKIIEISSIMLMKIDTRKYILHLRYCSATITDIFSSSVILNNSFFS